MTEPESDANPSPPDTHPPPASAQTDRLHRPPDEGPGLTGGSATTDDDPAADEEVGGG